MEKNKLIWKSEKLAISLKNRASIGEIRKDYVK